MGVETLNHNCRDFLQKRTLETTKKSFNWNYRELKVSWIIFFFYKTGHSFFHKRRTGWFLASISTHLL